LNISENSKVELYRMPFKKGKKKTGGRSSGTVNRTTKEARELLEQVLLGQVDNINGALNEVLKKDASKYLDACSKLFTYVLPKKADITSGEEKIAIKLPDIIIK
jgi:hypothetical protein